MPSFDAVSKLDHQEIDNAISNVLREISTRYDFKGSQTTVERKDKDLTVVTDDELKYTLNTYYRDTRDFEMRTESLGRYKINGNSGAAFGVDLEGWRTTFHRDSGLS